MKRKLTALGLALVLTLSIAGASGATNEITFAGNTHEIIHPIKTDGRVVLRCNYTRLTDDPQQGNTTWRLNNCVDERRNEMLMGYANFDQLTANVTTLQQFDLDFQGIGVGTAVLPSSLAPAGAPYLRINMLFTPSPLPNTDGTPFYDVPVTGQVRFSNN